MKKIITLTAILFLSLTQAYSCSFFLSSFCQSSSTDQINNENIISGEIINRFNHGIELKIHQVLKGNESASKILIWDGTDIDCNGLFSMSTVAYGQVGDTIICIIQTIDSIENTWDVIGEYRRPSLLTYLTFLPVANGTVQDLAQTEPTAYPSFLNNWTAENCSGTLNNNNIEDPTLRIFPNPTRDELFIESDQYSWEYYSVTSINGQLIQPLIRFKEANLIKVDALNPGIYILRMVNKDGKISTSRFVKM